MSSYSFYFCDVFPTDVDFVGWVKNLGLVDNPDENFIKYTYHLLFAEFATSSICYDTKEIFKRHFAIDYANLYTKYKKQLEIVNAKYECTIKDLNKVTSYIYNIANNDNQVVEVPQDVLINFISQQQSGATRENEFLTYVRDIQLMSDKLMNEYIGEFKKHFYRIFGEMDHCFMGVDIYGM